MSYDPRAITYIGTTDFRNQHTRFGIRARDRLRHTYIIGATGVGKSTLIENLIIQDIQNGNGVAMFDPHGTSAEKILDYVPEHRLQDVIYFAPFDLEHPIAFNPLEDPGPDLRFQVSDGLLSAFKKIWPDAFSARMEYILSMTLLALLEYPGSTLLSVNRMLAEKPFRQEVVNNIKDPSVKAFWVDEFMKWDEKYAREASAAIQNKVGQFTSNPLIRNILGQPESSINFRDIMDTKKIFIANLSKGRMGEQNAPLLGAMLITKLYLAAMSRADKSESEMHDLPPMYLYVDEFQNFANDSFENILSESRKYKLGLTIAHQYVAQMPENIQAAVFGNVGTKITFRTQKAEDAELFEKAFAPTFVQSDFMNLGMAQVYLTLMIDGVGSMPFSARTLPPIEKPMNPIAAQVIASSRSLYARPRAEVEERIASWYTPAPKPQNTNPTGERKTSSEDAEKKNAYFEQKRKEVEARGGVWLEPGEYKKIKEEGGTMPKQQPKPAQPEQRPVNTNPAPKAPEVVDRPVPEVETQPQADEPAPKPVSEPKTSGEPVKNRVLDEEVAGGSWINLSDISYDADGALQTPDKEAQNPAKKDPTVEYYTQTNTAKLRTAVERAERELPKKNPPENKTQPQLERQESGLTNNKNDRKYQTNEANSSDITTRDVDTAPRSGQTVFAPPAPVWSEISPEDLAKILGNLW